MGIGPSTKETTLHHFRDPLLDVVSNDSDIDFMIRELSLVPVKVRDNFIVYRGCKNG